MTTETTETTDKKSKKIAVRQDAIAEFNYDLLEAKESAANVDPKALIFPNFDSRADSTDAKLDPAFAADIKAKTDALTQSAMKLGEAMYKAQAQAGGEQGGESHSQPGGEKNDDVVDAVIPEQVDDVLHHRTVGNGEERLWDGRRERAQARAVAAGHDHGLNLKRLLRQQIGQLDQIDHARRFVNQRQLMDLPRAHEGQQPGAGGFRLDFHRGGNVVAPGTGQVAIEVVEERVRDDGDIIESLAGKFAAESLECAVDE